MYNRSPIDLKNVPVNPEVSEHRVISTSTFVTAEKIESEPLVRRREGGVSVRVGPPRSVYLRVDSYLVVVVE